MRCEEQRQLRHRERTPIMLELLGPRTVQFFHLGRQEPFEDCVPQQRVMEPHLRAGLSV